MKKIVFINFPVNGHVNPQINLCRELASKDVKLIYYTFDDFFPKFKGIDNLELRPYPEEFKKYYYGLAGDAALQRKFIAYLWVFYSLAEKVLPFTLSEVEKEKPDLIICDTLAIYGKIAARKYNIPMTYFFSSLMGDSIAMKKLPALTIGLLKSAVLHFPYVIKFNKVMKRLEKQHGKIIDKPQEIMAHQDLFSFVMTSRELHPGGDLYGDNVKFVGPAHVDDSEIPDNKDTIFISIGTIAISETFWDKAIEATKDLGYNVVISFGGNKHNKIKMNSLPENVKVYENLNLEEYRNVLKRGVLFISHGGFNSISDSILYKTPLLICPVSSEQATNGKLIEQMGCGQLYPKLEVDVKSLQKKALEVINSDSAKVGLEKYRQSFLNSMGYKKAVEELNKEFNLY